MNAKDIFLKLKTAPAPGYMSSDHALMAWGAQKFTTHDDSDAFGLYNLKFKVHSTGFKGWVRVSALDKEDNYNVTFEHYNNNSAEYSTYYKILKVKPENFIIAIDSILEPKVDEIDEPQRLAPKFDAKSLAKEFINQIKKDGNYLSEDFVEKWFERIRNI